LQEGGRNLFGKKVPSPSCTSPIFQKLLEKKKLIESFCQAFFKKLAPIQRAERWSPFANGEISLSLLSATKG